MPGTPRPEVLPDSHKPAEQAFELPLSARYGAPSSNQYDAPASGFHQPHLNQPSSTHISNGQLNMEGQLDDQVGNTDDQNMGQFENTAAQGNLISSDHKEQEDFSPFLDPQLETAAPATDEYQFTPAHEVTDYQYTPAPEGDIYQYTEAPEAPKDDQLHNDDIYQYNQDQGPNFGPNGAKEEVSKVLPGEEPGTFERIFNYFTGWGSKNKETTNTSPETPSWEKTRQGESIENLDEHVGDGLEVKSEESVEVLETTSVKVKE